MGGTEDNKLCNAIKQYLPIINFIDFRKEDYNPHCDSFSHILKYYRKQAKIIKFI